MKPAGNTATTATETGGGGAYWEPRVNAFVTAVAPGGFAVTGRADLAFATLLGSCVAACICDPRAGVGGLNHFLLPGDGGNPAPCAAAGATRYGAHAMAALIDEIVRQGGARPRLQAKLFGGANMIAMSSASPVGERNRTFALDFLRREGIPVTAAGLGGAQPRRVFFRPAVNMVLVRTADGDDAERVRREEARACRRACPGPAGGAAGVCR